jgi:activator of 2-hydroxyglutaryl-CoA dehydratase
VALNPEICRAIGEGLGVSLFLPSEPQMVGALGAALLGFER